MILADIVKSQDTQALRDYVKTRTTEFNCEIFPWDAGGEEFAAYMLRYEQWHTPFQALIAELPLATTIYKQPVHVAPSSFLKEFFLQAYTESKLYIPHQVFSNDLSFWDKYIPKNISGYDLFSLYIRAYQLGYMEVQEFLLSRRSLAPKESDWQLLSYQNLPVSGLDFLLRQGFVPTTEDLLSWVKMDEVLTTAQEYKSVVCKLQQSGFGSRITPELVKQMGLSYHDLFSETT